VLSISPLPTERFFFEGFLPARATARRKRLQELSMMSVSIVFFEAARRMRDTLEELRSTVDADRELLIAKELTKLHERVEVGSPDSLLRRLSDDDMFEHGEFVCVLGPSSALRGADDEHVDSLISALGMELPPAQAARIAARITGRSRADLYALALKRKRE
jgi:16S rRNA (cytidine1402-2'-O)-methyltransferase